MRVPISGVWITTIIQTATGVRSERWNQFTQTQPLFVWSKTRVWVLHRHAGTFQKSNLYTCHVFFSKVIFADQSHLTLWTTLEVWLHHYITALAMLHTYHYMQFLASNFLWLCMCHSWPAHITDQLCSHTLRGKLWLNMCTALPCFQCRWSPWGTF